MTEMNIVCKNCKTIFTIDYKRGRPPVLCSKKCKLETHKANVRKYYETNKDDILEYHKGYYQENREKCLEVNKEYYWKNRSEILLRIKIWRDKNREHVNAKQLEYYYMKKLKEVESDERIR